MRVPNMVGALVRRAEVEVSTDTDQVSRRLLMDFVMPDGKRWRLDASLVDAQWSEEKGGNG